MKTVVERIDPRGRIGRSTSVDGQYESFGMNTNGSKPICIDLFCGLSGFGQAFASEGWSVIGFDLEDMCAKFGVPRPEGCQLVLQDVLTLHGSQFRNADCIVASPPCQFFSYTAMPFRKGKERAARTRADESLLEKELALFKACFRIQREACEAAGRYIPMVVENVRGAQPWVGMAKWNYGSYYLWGNVPALMPHTFRGMKTVGHANKRNGHDHTRHLTNQIESDAMKIPGFRFDGSGRSFQSAAVKGMNRDIVNGRRILNPHDPRAHHGKSRKAASAMIAKIPFPLAQHIARVYYPNTSRQVETQRGQRQETARVNHD